MTVIAVISLVVLVAGVMTVNLARSPSAASAGMMISTVAAACLALSLFAWAFS